MILNPSALKLAFGNSKKVSSQKSDKLGKEPLYSKEKHIVGSQFPLFLDDVKVGTESFKMPITRLLVRLNKVTRPVLIRLDVLDKILTFYHILIT